jgi:arginyl-tRNA synthetase
MNQKQAFNTFATAHINKINEELGKLKIKYDEFDENFVAKEIAHKLKKAYQNRFYSICKILNATQ